MSTEVFEIESNQINDTFKILKQPKSIVRGAYTSRVGIYFIASCSYPESGVGTLYIRGNVIDSDILRIREYSRWKDVIIEWCRKEHFTLIIDGKNMTEDLGEL